MIGALGVAGVHLEQLRTRYPGATAEARPDGTVLVSVPDVALPPGWNQTTTAVRFLVPVGYPAARPDNFFADGTLKLANGNPPANASLQVPSGRSETCTLFSWHLSAWNPTVDTLVTYMRVIADRLQRVQ